MNTGYLITREVKRPIWFVLLAGLLLGPCSLLLSSQLSWFALVGGVVSTAALAWLVLVPNPWFGDTAFWRTRPISRKEMFLVKSVAMFLLGGGASRFGCRQ